MAETAVVSLVPQKIRSMHKPLALNTHLTKSAQEQAT